MNPQNNQATDANLLNAAPALSLSLRDVVISTETGWQVTGTLSYRNTGDQGATGVILTETLSAGAAFNVLASSPGWTETFPGSGVFALTIGNLSGAADGVALFAVNVPYPSDGGAKEIAERATLQDDGKNGSAAAPGDGVAVSTVELFAPAISSNGRRATFSSLEGDRETIIINRGTLSPTNFTFFALDRGTLRSGIHLSEDGAEFSGASIGITAKPAANGTGEGRGPGGDRSKRKYRSRSIKISGNVGRIEAGDGDPRKPAVARLTSALSAIARLPRSRTGCSNFCAARSRAGQVL